MKSILKLLFLGAIANMAFKVYRRQQRWDRGLPGKRRQPRVIDQVADTNSVVSGDAERKQREPQPQDWRGAQNVLE